MTTARDVIAWKLAKADKQVEPRPWHYKGADLALEALFSVPEPVRLELAAKLNPWRPIETAPKNDTEIEVKLLGGNRAIVFWDGGTEEAANKFPWCTSDGIGYQETTVVRWRPLFPATLSEDKA